MVLDPEQSSESISFSLTTAPEAGELTLNGSPLGTGSTFTQADVNNGLIEYTHNGGSSPDTFVLSASDGVAGARPTETDFEVLVR
jgi:hypothetical protein